MAVVPALAHCCSQGLNLLVTLTADPGVAPGAIVALLPGVAAEGNMLLLTRKNPP